MKPKSGVSDRRFVVVMVVSFVLGLTVALGVYLVWRSNPGPAQAQGLFTAAALTICPPFILSFAIGPRPDSDLALVLTVGTILFANGCLYAGVAAGLYTVVTVLTKKSHSPQRHR
ncbi:MAG TPA: hypothetical protein VKG65_04650 [Terriglobales bacterium]|nr:hypothetical protein [Terriglobales bacterium]